MSEPVPLRELLVRLLRDALAPPPKGKPRLLLTIGPEHLDMRRLGSYGWKLRECLGRVLPQDIGKRVYEITCDDGVRTIYQVENNEQRDARLAKEAAQ